MNGTSLRIITENENAEVIGGFSLFPSKPTPLGQVVPGIDELKRDFAVSFYDTTQVA